MSVRTIVEFNHDYAHKIDENGPEFLAWLRLALNSSNKDSWGKLDRFGVRMAAVAHHSDDRKVTVNGRSHDIP